MGHVGAIRNPPGLCQVACHGPVGRVEPITRCTANPGDRIQSRDGCRCGDGEGQQIISPIGTGKTNPAQGNGLGGTDMTIAEGGGVSRRRHRNIVSADDAAERSQSRNRDGIIAVIGFVGSHSARDGQRLLIDGELTVASACVCRVSAGITQI